MENGHSEKHHYYHCSRHHKNRGSFLGTLLVVLGILWLLKEAGWLHGLPGWDVVRDSFSNFGNIFHLGAITITWPVILLLVGILLIAGRRIIGGILLLFAILFFLPGIIVLPGLIAVFFLPVILIVLGIVVLRKLF